MNTEMKRMDELTSRLRESELSTDEQAELDALLQRCPEARRRFVDQMLLENDLREDAATLLAESATKTATTARHTSWFGWLAWHPLTAAAAGIVLGMFCTSMVFAYVAPSLGKVITLLQESFESGPAPLVIGVPIEAGQWSGDYTELVGEQQGVKPASGKGMLRFLRADYGGKTNADGYVADLYQLIDLRPYRSEFADGGAVLQFSAGFNAFAFPADESFAGLMSMHVLDAETVRSGALSDRQMLNAEALAMAGSSRLMLDRNLATWQRQTTELRLPPNTEFLLIHVGVTHATKAQRRPVFDGHFLDDVRLVLTRRAPLP